MKISEEKRNEWKQQAKQMEEECSNRLKSIMEDYKTDPALIADVLAFGSRFYNYSPNNMQLIYTQKRDAMYVQSFLDWKKEGVAVKKGEKGIKIRVPVKVTYLQTEDGMIKLSDATKEQQQAYKNGQIESKSVTRFKLGTVFDIGQTTFPPEEYPNLFSVGYNSAEHSAIVKGLEDYARYEIGYRVEIKDLSSMGLRGSCNYGKKVITINSILQDLQKLSTLAHEIGHAVIHENRPELSVHRKEFDADALSVMIEAGFGLETGIPRKEHFVSHYRAYCEEVKNELGEGFTDTILEKKITEVIESVHHNYAKCIDKINMYVDKYLTKEKDIEKNEISPVEPIQKGMDNIRKLEMLEEMQLER